MSDQFPCGCAAPSHCVSNGGGILPYGVHCRIQLHNDGLASLRTENERLRAALERARLWITFHNGGNAMVGEIDAALSLGDK